MGVGVGRQLGDRRINRDVVDKFVKHLVQHHTAFAEAHENDG